MKFLRLSLLLMAMVCIGVVAGSAPLLLPGRSVRPRLEHGEFVDLGAHPQGSIAVGRFQFKNAGGEVLVLKDFRSSCSCAGVEREVDGKFLKVESLQLRPEEEVELVIRMSVTAQAGRQQRIACTFESNDPDCPRGFVEAIVSRVLGGVVTVPTAVVFGEVPLGNRAKHTLNIYDNGQMGRRIRTVRSSQPERFTVALLPGITPDLGQSLEMAGRLIGTVEITPDTTREGALDGEVEIVLADEDRNPDRISVMGRVTCGLEFAPRCLVLPRAVDGVKVYHGEVRFRSHQKKPLSIQVASVDDDLLVQGLPGLSGEEVGRVRIEWKPAGKHSAKVQARVVHLRVRMGDTDYDRDVQVLLHENGKAKR